MKNWVQLAAYAYAHEAHMDKGLLEAEGIKCIIFDEGIVQANPLLSNAVGGIKLLVHNTEVERAREILSGDMLDEEPESTLPRE